MRITRIDDVAGMDPGALLIRSESVLLAHFAEAISVAPAQPTYRP
jgi:hypothetical protein